MTISTKNLDELRKNIKGDLFDDPTTLILYSTDASAYKEKPLAVIRPRDASDIQKIIQFASENNISIIPRTAGTSLAGQVVGNGIVVDVSKYMTNVLEVNPEEKWVRVQPGVVLDELNSSLKKHGLFFAPETSTSNRCMIGGMVGNNSCGAHSLIYGSTRDHLLEVKAFLSDGSEAIFKNLSKQEFEDKLKLNGLEGEIYQNINSILSDPENQKKIKEEYPDSRLKRRNTGYAIDQLLLSEPFTEVPDAFNFCKIIAGSEGTLAFITEIKLNLVPLPPQEKALVCIHFNSLEEALKANLLALKHKPQAIELMDEVILECTKSNIEQRKNRFFLQGDPAAILIVEFAFNSRKELEEAGESLIKDMKFNNFGYHYPVVSGNEINRVWALRKAGLGLLSNLPGDAKPVSVIEDTAVHPEYLPEYIEDFKQILAKYKLECVYHAHIATGELHLRPVLNLKDKNDLVLFRTIAGEIAHLVKKYNGSLSGEHGDGRLRGEFIPVIVGEHNFQLLKEIKKTWDPNNVFNQGKIIDTPRMDTFLRYDAEQETRDIETIFDFSATQGILRLAEKCNGSGDCRKSALIGGTMCPSFMATRDENTTTRARANVLREFLTHSSKKNPFDHKEIYNVLDLCLSCKGCKSECPSGVDMAKLKAEFLQHYYDANGIPLRSRLFAYITYINRLGAVWPWFFNWFTNNKFLFGWIKKLLGIAKKRSIPKLHRQTLNKWISKNLDKLNNQLSSDASSLYLFVDEFTNYNDSITGIKAIQLLNKLGYRILTKKSTESGRTYISKGLLRKARQKALRNIECYTDIITEQTPLVGIEPSAILTFRDEYPDLANEKLKDAANRLAELTMTFEEFIAGEIEKGKITPDQFTDKKQKIKLHGHCQQKAVASTLPTIKMLSIPANYSVEEIKSGCCGMAGSFGYEKEHYDLSQKVGELVLFPAVRESNNDTLIAAPGTSCRHQIKDGTDREAMHPIEILFDAII